LRSSKDCYNLIAKNPVAGARFFHFLTTMFIKHVLGVGTNHKGLYGETAGYYGTVEQQGRLTLHLHLLLWIKGSLTPQEIRDKVMDTNSDFQQKLVQYLESLCIGQFLTGNKMEISQMISKASKDPTYLDPTYTLPKAPVSDCTRCKKNCCLQHQNKMSWWQNFKYCVDDILLRSNIHSHKIDHDGKTKSYCLNSKGQCKRRFPREIFEKTFVEPKTGALHLKKGEPWMNTITPTLTYLLRCNSDVTSLLSGTAIKAVVAYVTDYITKQTLKTYTVFDVIKSVFDGNIEILEGNLNRKEKVRKLFTQIVNSLTAKMEIGSPMASLYILGNPDHYTNYQFENFYWKPYVKHIINAFDDDIQDITDLNNISDKVVISKAKGSLIALSKINDYIYRPTIYEDVNLYDWIRLARKEKIYKQTTGQNKKDEKFNLSNNLNNIKIDSSYRFQPNHPQYETHKIHMQMNNPFIIPNFLPNNLPRSDHGDHEYYCCTMLTIFKPWRFHLDLKSQLDSWHKKFMKYKFTNHQLQIMKYFNIRYECLDARDDFSTKYNKSDAELIHYQWIMQDTLDELDKEYYSYNGDDFGIDQNVDNMEGEHFNIPGPKGLHKLHTMMNAERTMQISGWLDECEDSMPDLIIPIQPLINQSGKLWRQAVLSKRQEILDERNKNLPGSSSQNNHVALFEPNEVKIIDQSYLSKTFKAISQQDSHLINTCIHEFNLNTEQKRAFVIIANHATIKMPNKLHMYLGGMAGTGKTQVITSLIHFFTQHKESHRFLVLAPTGAAAALLNGSTYHSVLGINDNDFFSAKSLAQIRANLDGVDYIFIDEVSMISCRDLYKISSQCAKARGEHNEPFGGINIIFAGDFSQLPPAMGASPLYSGNVGTQIQSSQSLEKQEASIGKALWHQVTVVVILRQNMRQNKQSKKDYQLRTALENMRYKACTPEDISFLHSRIAGRNVHEPKLAQRNFRNVSVITALNAQKDTINELGSK